MCFKVFANFGDNCSTFFSNDTQQTHGKKGCFTTLSEEKKTKRAGSLRDVCLCNPKNMFSAKQALTKEEKVTLLSKKHQNKAEGV